MGIFATGEKAATAKRITPATITLPGLILMLVDRLGGLRLGTLGENGSKLRRLPVERDPEARCFSWSSDFSRISSISRSNLDLSGIGDFYLVDEVRVVILENQ
jgi:hypothetical protein